MERKITGENIRFGVVSFVLLLVTHAIAYLTHEYSHSLTAWSLGWMSKPFGIDYGHPTLYNFLFLDDVGDNVNYPPIFASGHGLDAALIALAGPFVGNGLAYFIVYSLIRRTAVGTNRPGIAFAYWFSLMCAGNVWGYVPLRAITTHADIALAAEGLHVSVWALFPFVAAPSLYIVQHFFRRTFPLCQQKITGGCGNNFIVLVTLTAFWFFSFFGGDGISGNYGLVSQLLCITSKYLLLPFCTLYLMSRYYGSYQSGQSGRAQVATERVP
ncbi:hypothetical protein IHE49_07815 [Rhodanobacter sp. 7MK24]|uniref:hypothetical protein n=1 Tax=Rhodanobacter sp. 7MK24 TaxID=2775922 RepID=UPI0017859A3F|nr:hypothetical protein [Rhodanobacter sp. 7MK24]MBD8880384.1 hypothetical protein [Rhodanobacter sp. 7MK24]